MKKYNWRKYKNGGSEIFFTRDLAEGTDTNNHYINYVLVADRAVRAWEDVCLVVYFRMFE